MDVAMQSKWLSPLDLCMLKVEEPWVDLKAYRNKNCSKLAGTGGSLSQKLFCNIGSSLGRQCAPPLSTRSFFTARLKDDYLGDPNAKYLSESLKLIASSSRPIVFVGDGLSKQNQDALICEIMRTDKVTVTGSMSGESSQLQSNFTVRWREAGLKLDVLYYKMTHVQEKADRVRRRTKLLRKLLPDNSSEPAADNSTNVTGPRGTSVSFDDVRSSIEALSAQHKGVVLVANLGVWYNSREKFRLEMPAFLQWLNGVGQQPGRNNLVFFRETAAQHWNQSDNGYYSFEERETNNGSCSPVADSTPGETMRTHQLHLHLS